MARRTQAELPFDVRTYAPENWLRFGETATPTEREKIIYVAVEEVVKAGLVDFTVKDVCDRLGVSPASITHYFGGREALLAEVILVSYRKAINDLRARLIAGPKDQELRIRLWVEDSMEWSRRMGPFAVLVNFPLGSKATNHVLESKFGNEMRQYFEFYLAILATLVVDLREGTVSDFEFGVSSLPKRKLLGRPAAAIAAASMAWSMLGISVWSSGGHFPSQGAGDPTFSEEFAIRSHIKNMIAVAKGE
jgi:AcrR family transcriptional regulator